LVRHDDRVGYVHLTSGRPPQPATRCRSRSVRDQTLLPA
jgi:hypothetical protein